MAHKANEIAVFVDRFLFKGHASSFNLQLGVQEHLGNVLASTADEYEPGLPVCRLTMDGLFRGVAAGGFEALLQSKLASLNTTLSTCLPVAGGVVGGPAYVITRCARVNNTYVAPTSGLIALNGEWLATEGVRRGITIFHGIFSEAGTSDPVDLGAGGSAGGTAFVIVRTINGTAEDAKIAVESATTEGGTYASEGDSTFSTVGVKTISMSGVVNRWVRLNCSDLGDATSITVTGIVCVPGVTEPS